MKRIVCLVLALALVGPSVAAARAPRPIAGVVPLDIEDVADAEGERLRVDDDYDLAGKRVRFVAEVDDLGVTSGGEHFLALEGDGERVVLRLPGPLERSDRLEDADEWAVIARLDRPMTLADGTKAIAVAPDILVKTPGPPGVVRPDDVIVEVAGEEFFGKPTARTWESAKPLFHLTVLEKGDRAEPYLLPGATGLAESRKGGKTLFDFQQVTGAADGRKRARRCVYRLDGDRLRNTGFGEVDLDAAGARSRQRWVDFAGDKYHDSWSGVRKSFPPSTYQGACLSVGMTGFPLDAGVVRFFLWGERGMPVPVYAYVDGEDTLETRGRAERAHRVRVGLDVRRAAWLVDVPKAFKANAEAAIETWYAGDSTYWIAADGSHDVLRFEGPLGPPGSPVVRIDRIG